MPCPECSDTHLTQQRDLWTFKCGGCKRVFRLVEVRQCANCGEFKVLEPSGLCRECIKKLVEVR